MINLVKRVRRIVRLGAGAGIILSAVLLLNFTASNPTHRRYSSAVPLTTGQASGNAIGLDGEEILAKDLGLPRNEAADERQCICGTDNTHQAHCNACIVSLPSITTYRRPDFVSTGFIAEAKNQRALRVEDGSFEQILDYVDAARALGVPLWLFTRVDTVVDPQFRDAIRSTGGDVVMYFAVPGYEDPVDAAAKKGLAASGVVLVLTFVPEVPSIRLRVRRLKATPAQRGTAALNEAERLLGNVKDKAAGE